MGTGVRIATASVRTGLAMTLVFHGGCGVRRGTWAPPYKGLCEDCRRTGAFAPTQSKEMRTSTDGRGRTPPLRKRCKECGALSAGGQRRPPLRKRNKRCNGRATARVAPTKALQGVRRGEKNPPVTASPCQPPLGKGAMGTGVRIATASVRTGLAMTLVFHGGAVCGGAHGPRPTRVFAILRADRGVCPYAKQGDANKHGRAG